MRTHLVAVREPTPAERKRGADVVFERRAGKRGHGMLYVILACRCYEGWEQWGAPREVLADNVPAVDRWRREGLQSFEGVA